MHALEIKNIMRTNLPKISGLDQHRPYLGMSSISNCPRQLYHQYLNGRGYQSDRDHYFCLLGYTYEALVLKLLGVQKQDIEVVAEFDARFRGHVDHVLDNDLVEVKSLGWDDYLTVVDRRESQHHHFEQVQMYMEHGGWKICHLIYVPRDIPRNCWRDLPGGLPWWIFDVYPKPEIQMSLDLKAKRILKAVDIGEVPNCVCGRCR